MHHDLIFHYFHSKVINVIFRKHPWYTKVLISPLWFNLPRIKYHHWCLRWGFPLVASVLKAPNSLFKHLHPHRSQSLKRDGSSGQPEFMSCLTANLTKHLLDLINVILNLEHNKPKARGKKALTLKGTLCLWMACWGLCKRTAQLCLISWNINVLLISRWYL